MLVPPRHEEKRHQVLFSYTKSCTDLVVWSLLSLFYLNKVPIILALWHMSLELLKNAKCCPKKMISVSLKSQLSTKVMQAWNWWNLNWSEKGGGGSSVGKHLFDRSLAHICCQDLCDFLWSYVPLFRLPCPGLLRRLPPSASFHVSTAITVDQIWGNHSCGPLL